MVRVLATKIIVPLTIEMINWVRIDITAGNSGEHKLGSVGRLRIARICKYGIERSMGKIGISKIPAIELIVALRKQSNGVDKDIIIFKRLVMKIVGADAEIERAAEVRCQSQFLRELLRTLFGEIFADNRLEHPSCGSQNSLSNPIK